MPEYVLEPGHTGDSRLPVSLDGVNWAEAKIPWRWHLCWVQTKYVGRTSVGAGRCACGAWTRDGGKTWVNKNLRRRKGRHRA